MASKSQPQQHCGKLVALEGDVETVATQLRLLPPSQKILVLPPLQDPLPQESEVQAFDARAFVRNVHTNFKQRTERARLFLQSSTNTQPRLVFMNGGSVSARTTCITKISENITNGDVGEAEVLFNEIVKDGVAGLIKQDTATEEEVNKMETTPADDAQPQVAEWEEDPIVKAMKAADSLDRETAELQDDSLGCAVELGPDTPRKRWAAKAEVSPKAHHAAFATSTGDDIVRTVVTLAKQSPRQAKTSTFGQGDEAETTPTTGAFTARTTITHQGDGYDDDCDDDNDQSLAGDEFNSPPPTPAVIYGEARVVDVANVSPKRTARRVKSVEILPPRQTNFDDWETRPTTTLRHTKSAYHIGRPRTAEGRKPVKEPSPILPTSTFMRASPTVIRKPSWTGSSTYSVSTPKVHVFVDRGTDAEDLTTEEVPLAIEVEAFAPFEPVFPLIEDLVIRFAHDTPSDIFEYVISMYKSGSYPVIPTSQESDLPNQELHETVDGEDASLRHMSSLTAETDDDGFHRRHEFDPYADNNYPADVNQWPMKDAALRIKSTRNAQPPTPSSTPPPTARGVPEKICEFTPMNPNSVIGIHNSLRALLNLHFPAGENGYTQYTFSVPSEMDRLWKPVFRNDTDSPIGNEGRTVDQIIALGCEEGVKKDFFAQVSGQIEKLGMKREGLNKASKVDLRYFIATAMQAHSNLPLNIQSTSNPFSSPEVLAACIVPQIEAYLATNNSTRLLVLHYPSEHLATALALRKLLGQEILKIAGIMDSLSSDPPSRSTSAANPLSNEATLKIRRPSQGPVRHSINASVNTLSSNESSKKEAVSFSKANYLLPSSATETEVATFLSGIWTGLVEKSIYYTPEPEPEPKTVIVEKIVEKVIEKYIEKPAPPPLPSSRDNSHPPVSYRANSRDRGASRESKLARLTGEKTPPRTPTSGLAKGHKYAASFASGRTTASERVRREDARIEKDWENFYIGEEDSEDDDYDRMILGREMAKIVPEVKKVYPEGKAPKRSTKKALKWLGLA